MANIRSYFGEILVILAASGLLFAASPEGKTKKYIKLLISLSLTAALTVPLLSVAAEVPKLLSKSVELAEEESPEISEQKEDALIAASVREVEGAICALLSEKFGIPKGDIRCRITADTSDKSKIEIEKVSLRLPPTCPKEAISSYLSDLLLGKSEIVIEEES